MASFDNIDDILHGGDHFPEDYILAHTHIADLQNTQFLVIFGMARSGTTGFQYLLTSLGLFDLSFFQGFKGVLRHGKPSIYVNGNAVRVLFKEVVGPSYGWEMYDPVSYLLQLGVPRQNIKVLFMMRYPPHAYDSWDKYTDVISPAYYAQCQDYIIQKYHYYKHLGMHVVAFDYDLMIVGTLRVVNRVMKALNFPPHKNPLLRFNKNIIAKHFIPGEAADPTYDNLVTAPILGKGRFAYMPFRTKEFKYMPEDHRKQVLSLCMKGYRKFRAQSRKDLRLPPIWLDFFGLAHYLVRRTLIKKT